MDPDLEQPDIFPDFHDSFVTYLRESLQPQLPDPYYAVIGRRAWIEVSWRFIGPDVDVVAARRKDTHLNRPGGTAAVSAAPSAQPVVCRHCTT